MGRILADAKTSDAPINNELDGRATQDERITPHVKYMSEIPGFHEVNTPRDSADTLEVTTKGIKVLPIKYGDGVPYLEVRGTLSQESHESLLADQLLVGQANTNLLGSQCYIGKHSLVLARFLIDPMSLQNKSPLTPSELHAICEPSYADHTYMLGALSLHPLSEGKQ